MYIVVIVLLGFAAVPVTPNHHDIHKRMTSDEVLGIFQTDHANVPKYDVVRIESTKIDKRDTRSRKALRIERSNEEINMMLESTDQYLAFQGTPVTIASLAHDGSVQYVDELGVMEKIGILMHNRKTRSSFVVSKTTSGHDAFNGFVGSHNMIVRSLPEHLSRSIELSRQARSIDDSGSSGNASYHIMYQANKQSPAPNFSIRRLNETEMQPPSIRNRRDVGDIIYPELLLIVDHTSFRLHGSSVPNVVRYLLTLFNSVDMTYSNFPKTTIRLNIARIIIAKVAEATPYIIFRSKSDKTVAAEKTLNEVGKHFYLQRPRIPQKSYDALMIITSNELLDKKGSPVGGMATRKSACVYNIVQKKFIGNSIFHDRGSYDGTTPAHELGHMLGANDDKSGKCPADAGYLMAPVQIWGPNMWNFSSCSVDEIETFLKIKRRNSDCMKNEPRGMGKVLPRIWEGSFTSLDEQCKKLGEVKFCGDQREVTANICFELKCQRSKDKPDDCDLFDQGAVDGTPCGGNRICFRGECVQK